MTVASTYVDSELGIAPAQSSAELATDPAATGSELRAS